MKKSVGLLICLAVVQLVRAQTISQKLAKAVQQFEADVQMRHAIMSLYVTDAKTGKPVYAHHQQTGLAPASTQKLFTSVAALELLGPDYRYKTKLGYDGKLENGLLRGNLYIIGSGDPSFGSWRYGNTKEELILAGWIKEIQQQNIKRVQGVVKGFVESLKWDNEAIPDGWIWQDIGNYYGAGASELNWRENQYDLVMRPGKAVGDSVEIITTKPLLHTIQLNCKVTTGTATSGDNAYIYLPPYSGYGTVRGTIPAGGNEFVISGSFPDPTGQLVQTLTEELKKKNIPVDNDYKNIVADKSLVVPLTLSVHHSPALDSLNFWFLRRSINLYGEAFLKTIAAEKSDTASTEKGIELVKDFWSKKGIDKAAINIADGSGLSPLNRVTTHAEVAVLQYAKTRPWFSSFYNALPEYNSMKMKSGSISGARAYAGYHKAKDGKEYIFSIIVNNYDGSSGEVVKKMYKVLDVLK